MRPVRMALCVLLVLYPSFNSVAQSVPGIQDPQAVQALQSALTALGGGAAISTLQDFQSHGQITYNWANQSAGIGTVTVYGKGLAKFRFDAVLPAGTRSFKLTNTNGSLTLENGTTTALASANLLNTGSLTFPAFRIANILNISTTASGVVWSKETLVGAAARA
jgi:hypothetical protein